MRDFYSESHHYFDQVLHDCEHGVRPATQLLTINFELRARKYIDDSRQDDDLADEDGIFGKLYELIKSLIQRPAHVDPEIPLQIDTAHASLPMAVYTASYLKQLVRILQTNKG